MADFQPSADVSEVREILSDLGWSTTFLAWICGRKRGNIRSMLAGQRPVDPDMLAWLRLVRETSGENVIGTDLARWIELVRDATGSDTLPADVAAWLPTYYAAVCDRPETLKVREDDDDEGTGD
jgi:hypothetical protein